MMKNIVLCLFLNIFNLIESSLVSCVSTRNIAFDNVQVEDRLLWSTVTTSARRCAVQCLRDERCVVFFYSASGGCRAHSVAISDEIALTKSLGWKYYITCRGMLSHLYRMKCTSHFELFEGCNYNSIRILKVYYLRKY